MRTIKFRVFDKVRKEMAFTRDINKDFDWAVRDFKDFDDNVNPYEDDQSELMQFTWLLDKNWKEIYEGDIVKRWEVVWLVEMLWHAWCVTSKDVWVTLNPFWHQTWWPNGDYHKMVEVIGNIYENPELLSDNK